MIQETTRMIGWTNARIIQSVRCKA